MQHTRRANIQEKANLIWAIADKLVGTYKPHEYGNVILPMCVIKRFSDTIAPTKDKVIEMNKSLDARGIVVKDGFLRNASGYDFYNVSPFTFEGLLSDANNIADNFRSYLNHFSKNVIDVIEKFDFDKEILFLSALLHDVGKIKRTKIKDDGHISSKGHSFYGSLTVREFLWKTLGLCGSKELQNLRESVCLLIKYHSFPPYSINENGNVKKLLKIASNGELVSGFNLKKLYVLEKADVLGRKSSDKNLQLEKVEYFKMLCEDNNCYEKPFKFSSPFTMRSYFLDKTAWPNDNLFKNSWGEVILLSGLPGTGKDTFIHKNYDLPVISLDEIRKTLKVLPTDNQSAVIYYAHEKAKDFLRKKQSFIWNATNITYELRGKNISLFEKLNASVKTVFLETDVQTQLYRNKNRPDVVPQNVLDKMLLKLELPERYESETVEYVLT